MGYAMGESLDLRGFRFIVKPYQFFGIETSNRYFESYFQLWQITLSTSAQGFMTSRTLDPREKVAPSLLNVTIMTPERDFNGNICAF